MEQREIGALNESALKIMSRMDSDDLLETILREATQLLRGKSAGIFEYHVSSEELELVADWQITPSLKGHTLKTGEGLAGRVVEARKTIPIENYDEWEGRSDRVEKGILKAVVAAPLLQSGDVLGVLFVSDDQEKRTFEASDIQLLDILAGYAAIAISKANTLNQLRVLDEINVRLNAANNLDDILETILHESLKAMRTDEGSILFVNRETNELEFKYWIVDGLVKDKLDRKLYVGKGIAGIVARTGEPRNCEDTDNDPDFVPSLTKRPIQSLLCVPIISHGRVTYVISADSLRKRFFSKESAHFLSAIAGRAAVAIESQKLRDIGAKLITLPMDQMLAKIVESACMLTGMEAGTIFVKDRLSNNIRREASYPIREREHDAPRADGLTREILDSGEPVIVSDAQQNARVRDSVKKEGVQVIIGVPLKMRGEALTESTGASERRLFGVLFLNSRQPHNQIDRALVVLKNLATYASVAIENAWLLEAEKHRVEMLDSLRRTSLQITSELQVPELGRLMLDCAVGLLKGHGGGLYLADNEKKTLSLATVSNLPVEYLGHPIDMQKSLVGRVIMEGKAGLQHSYHTWEHRLRLFDEHRLTAVAAAPIQWQGKTYGAIAVHDVIDGRTFTSEDLDMLSHLGNLAAVALENARQTDDLKRVMESSFDAIIAVNEKGTIVRMNDHAKSILGRENEKMTGQDVRHLYYYPNDAKTIKSLLQINADESKNTEGRLRDYFTFLRGINDEKIPILLSASVLVDYEGKRAGSVGFFQDVRKAERAQREVRVLQGLLAASRVVASTTSLDDALHAICDEVTKSLEGVHSVTLYHRDSETGEIKVPPEHRGVKNEKMWIGPTKPDSPVIKAIELGTAQFIEDATAEDSIVRGDFVYREGIKSAVAAPLKIGNRTIGVMFLNYKEPHRFSAPEQEVIKIFARNVAIVLENARLYEASRQQTEKLMTIREEKLSYLPSMFHSLSPEDTSLLAVLQEIADRARHITRANYGALAVLNADGKIEEFIPSGLDAEIISRIGNHPIGLGVLGLLLRNKDIINESDITQHRSFGSFPSEHPPISSFLGVPIESRGRVIGSFYVGNKKETSNFSEGDAMALRALADQAAIAIENARLYETTKKSLNESQILHEQTKRLVDEARVLQQACFKLAEFAEPRDLLNHVMHSVMELRGANSGSILLYDPKRGEFTEALRCNELGQSLEPYQTSVTQRPDDIAYSIVRTRTPKFVADISTDEHFSPHARENWRSVAGLPLTSKEGPVGVFYINWNESHAFPDQEREWLKALAAQASLAVDSFRSREAINAAQNINSALLLVSRWSHKVEANDFALNVDLKLLKRSMPSGMFDKIFDRMSAAIRESSFSIKSFLRMGSENEPVDLKELLREVVTKLCETQDEIVSRFEMPVEGCLIRGNKTLVKTAVEILIENAILSIRGKQVPGEIKIKISMGDEIARTEVSDNGLGIRPDMLRDIYRNSKEADTGYGYSLAATILKRHKGDMRIVNTNAKGTTVEFWLPLAEVANVKAQSA